MEYLTPKMVSETLHIGVSKAYKLFGLQGFPAVKIGRQWVIESEELKRFLREYRGCEIKLG